jgi:2-polyprenyl-6-methoxyphenol hydroxylase-like FAD-dependent oxidoreductase
MGNTVLVIGAGPVGLSAALMLARHGTSVRIIDSNEGPTPLSKALVLWKRSLQVLDPVIPWEKFLEGHMTASQGLFYQGGKQIATLPFQNKSRCLPAGIFIPQSDTESILISTLASYGVVVERNTKLVGFQTSDEFVTCEFNTGEKVETPWLIGCDGAHSTIRHGLNLEFCGNTVDRRWLLADVIVDSEAPKGSAIMESGPDGFLALFPISANRWRLIADGGPHEAGVQYTDPTITEVQSIFTKRSSMQWVVRDTKWTGQFSINERQVENYVHGRILLAGDAAHVHSPAGGQGMNTGIQDAVNLAWKISLVERGAASVDLLQTYQDERHPIGAMVLKFTAQMLKASMIKNPALRTVQAIGMHLALSVPSIQRHMASFLSEDNITYRGGPLAPKTNGSFRPGDAFPDLDIEGESATNLLRGNEATLVTSKSGFPMEFGKKGFPITEVISKKLTGQLGGDVLVRPDGVIAAIGSDNIQEWLGSILLASNTTSLN